MNSNNSQEIDLSVLSQKASSFFNNIGYSIFKVIRFIIKNIFIFIGLIIIGAVIGYFLDSKKNEIYKHEVIVIPNFESSTYLYTAIANLEYDLKKSPIVEVTITPIVDVFQFVSSGNNLEVAKYLSENNVQIEKHKKGNQTEHIYKYHLITIKTKGEDKDGKIVAAFLNELNQEPFFLEKQKIASENRKTKTFEFDKSIEDINVIFKKMGTDQGIKTSEINVEMNSQINDLLDNKKHMVESKGWIKIAELEESKVIYEASKFINIKSKSKTYSLALPVLLVGLFLFFGFLRNIYKKHKDTI